MIPNIITTSELALSVKHSAESQILDLNITSYIYYNIDLFNKIAPTLYKIIQRNALTLSIYGIRAITIRLLNTAKAVLELVLYIPELQLNLVSLSRLIQKGAKISFLQGSADIVLKLGTKLKAIINA